MEDGYARSASEVLEFFGVDPAKGLTDPQVAEYSRIYGKNGLPAVFANIIPTPLPKNPIRLRPRLMKSQNNGETSDSTKLMLFPFANFALNYFNSSENADFKLVEVTRAGYSLAPMSTIHLNFQALSNRGNSHLFYAELKTRNFDKVDEKGTQVLGCSLLEKVDSGNPLGYGCCICSNKVTHPGPKDGHIVIAGDQFEGASFWKYSGSRGLDSAQIRQRTARLINMYTACAKKAIKRLNGIVKADWELLKVIAAADRLDRCRTVIHLNFEVKSSNFSVSRLCFAELFLPLFQSDSANQWIVEKEPFLEVGGCCIMQKDVTYESHLGRTCLVCGDALIHPGPRYGYREFAGDMIVFDEHDFKRVGTGVF